MGRQPFKDWQPDLPKLLNPGVLLAKNTVPIAGGFGPMPSFVDGGESAADDYVRGAWSAIDNSRNPHLFAGDAMKLYRIYTAGLADASKAGGYNASQKIRWEFQTFGDNVFATNPNDKLQYFNLRTSSLFADVEGDFVPRFRHIGIIKNHLVGGNFFDSIEGSVPNGIAWPAIGDPLTWPDPGSDTAVQLQSDRQPLPGAGGWVQAVIAGSEIGAVFQETAIWRVDYRGGRVVFELNKVEPNYGLLYPGLAVAYGRQVFFLSENGFRLFDYTSSRPIGKERIDRWFFNELDEDNAHRIHSILDPDETRCWTIFPGSGNTGGLPNKVLVYDFALDRFSHGDQALEALTIYLTPNMETLDSPPLEDIDNTTGSFDDPVSGLGAATLGAWDGNHKIGTLDGPSLDAVFETGYLEIVPGRRGKIRGIRPLITGDCKPTIQVAPIESLKETPVYKLAQGLTRSGISPQRASGRYHQIRTMVNGLHFDEALGLDIEVGPGGRK